MDYESFAFRHAPDATFVLANRIIVRASNMVHHVFGWQPKELEGQSVRVLYPGQTDFERIGEQARQALLSQSFYSDERFMRRKDGQIVWMQGRGCTLDQSDPYRVTVWSYRPMDAGPGTAGLLTGAEKRVAKFLVNGFTSKEIAKALDCSHRTVESHRANMIRKMGVRNSSELVRKLFEVGSGDL